MSRKHDEEGHVNHERWLVTYSDLITLLLAFFIILYSMSNVDAEKYKKLAAALGNAFNTTTGDKGTGLGAGEGPSSGGKETEKSAGATAKPSEEAAKAQQKSPEISAEFKELAGKIEKISQEQGLGGRIILREEGRGLILELTDTLLFPSGKALMSDESKRVLYAIGKELSNIENHVRVEGHTDNVPISNYLYPNNWHLSTARAMAVIDYWETKQLIKPDELSGAGYGEHRPIASNDTATGRSKNRRVDIVIIRNSLTAQEPQASAEAMDKTGGQPSNQAGTTEGSKEVQGDGGHNATTNNTSAPKEQAAGTGH